MTSLQRRSQSCTVWVAVTPAPPPPPSPSRIIHYRPGPSTGPVWTAIAARYVTHWEIRRYGSPRGRQVPSPPLSRPLSCCRSSPDPNRSYSLFLLAYYPSMVVRLRRVDISHPSCHYMWQILLAPPPPRKSWARHCVPASNIHIYPFSTPSHRCDERVIMNPYDPKHWKSDMKKLHFLSVCLDFKKKNGKKFDLKVFDEVTRQVRVKMLGVGTGWDLHAKRH